MKPDTKTMVRASAENLRIVTMSISNPGGKGGGELVTFLFNEEDNKKAWEFFNWLLRDEQRNANTKGKTDGNHSG